MSDEQPSPLQIASQVVGILSICCWLIAQAPQIIKNFRNKDATALSAGFLTLWTLGDTTNLIGCFLTNQSTTQILTAIYFCAVDATLWFQWIYYQLYPQVKKRSSTVAEKQRLINGDRGGSMASVLVIAPLTLVATMTRFSFAPALANSTGRALLASEDETVAIVGVVIAWTCTALYVSSRLPQIYLNFKRRSVEGLAITLFIFAVLGNLTYAASIFLNSVEPEHLLNSLPYIIGSAGTIIFDVTIFVQFWVYGRPKEGYERATSTTSYGSPALPPSP